MQWFWQYFILFVLVSLILFLFLVFVVLNFDSVACLVYMEEKRVSYALLLFWLYYELRAMNKEQTFSNRIWANWMNDAIVCELETMSMSMPIAVADDHDKERTMFCIVFQLNDKIFRWRKKH